MLMMLDPNFSSKLVSMFNALFSKRLGSCFSSVAMFDHFPCAFDVF